MVASLPWAVQQSSLFLRLGQQQELVLEPWMRLVPWQEQAALLLEEQAALRLEEQAASRLEQAALRLEQAALRQEERQEERQQFQPGLTWHLWAWQLLSRLVPCWTSWHRVSTKHSMNSLNIKHNL